MKISFEVESKEELLPVIEALLDGSRALQQKSYDISKQAIDVENGSMLHRCFPGELKVLSSMYFAKSRAVLKVAECIVNQYAGKEVKE